MTERRYSEDEVEQIFEQAEAQASGLRRAPRGEGLTLGDLEEIGREVGISAEHIARAARSLDRPAHPSTRRFLGALVEPTPHGDRLRLRTLKGSARSLMTTGLSLGAVSVILFLIAFLVEAPVSPDRIDDLLTIGLIGAGLFGFSAVRLPAWAGQRRRQMEAVADRLIAAPSAQLAGDPGTDTNEDDDRG